MNEEKISSDKVPEKFAEWLLGMGCPPEKVPTLDKIAEMCRGQYYMVWRSLMEHVESKHSTKEKRLQVFRDDIQRCQENNVFHKRDSSVVVPEELSLWKQQVDLKQKVADAESRIVQARHAQNQLMDKISSKLSHRGLARGRLQDTQRRLWLLRQVADELRAKRDNLLETRAIADSLCLIEESADIDSKLDQCLSALSRAARRPAPAQPARGAVPNSEHDTEEHVVSLVKSGGATLCARLCERRAALAAALPTPPASTRRDDATDRVSPQTVLSHTAALHCSLVLDTMKHRTHIKQTRKRLTASLTDLNNYLSGEECELVVLRCERGRAAARAQALQAALGELAARVGPFAAVHAHTPADRDATIQQIAAIDKAIESKRDELKRLITTLAITERKIQNVRDGLMTVFGCFHGDAGYQYDRFGGQLSLPQESIPSLRRYYSEGYEKRNGKMELSMNLDASDRSWDDSTANASPTFVDELRIYLKKFNLEKNRQLVLESGEKVWVSQTVGASIERLHGRWQHDGVACALACPSAGLARGLRGLRGLLEPALTQLPGVHSKHVIDITSMRDEEDKMAEKIKKRLNESLVSLQKTGRMLLHGRDNLRLWADNQARTHICTRRTVNGKTYKEYETYYLDTLNI